MAGLRREAIDFAGATFQIVRTRISVDGKTIDSTPKTGAATSLVPIDTSLVALLQADETRQRLNASAPERLGRLGGHVLADELDRPYHADYLLNRFDKHVQDSGLPRIRLHDTRHTACSLMLASGVPR